MSTATKTENKFITSILDKINLVNAQDWEKYTNYIPEVPKNIFTNLPYKGFNLLSLFLDTVINKYKSNKYATFKAIADAGGKLRKGSKGALIEFFSWFYIHKETGKKINETEYKKLSISERKEYKKLPIIRNYIVFNADLIENSDSLNLNIQDENFEENEFLEITNAELLINQITERYNATIEHNKTDIACYIPSSDKIKIPYKNLFISEQKYYSTLFHELAHWTGHETRLNRELKGHNDIKSYSFEELVAEMTSMLICTELGLMEEFINSVRYLKGWSKVNGINTEENIKNAFSYSKKAKNYLCKHE